jgi:predicted RNA-binding Zn-ribbon protein involved in translation (DUF1610 family)
MTSPANKLSIVLNRSVPVGVAMNAVSHLAASMTALAYKHGMEAALCFCDFPVQEGAHKYPCVSCCSFVILEATKPQHLVKAYEEAQEQSEVLRNGFLTTMRLGTAAEQWERCAQLRVDQVEYIACGFFGPIDKVNKLTKKFRLYNGSSS